MHNPALIVCGGAGGPSGKLIKRPPQMGNDIASYNVTEDASTYYCAKGIKPQQ